MDGLPENIEVTAILLFLIVKELINRLEAKKGGSLLNGGFKELMEKLRGLHDWHFKEETPSQAARKTEMKIEELSVVVGGLTDAMNCNTEEVKRNTGKFGKMLDNMSSQHLELIEEIRKIQ